MPCRECPGCDRRFPSGISATACPWCRKTLTYDAKNSPDTDRDEYNRQRWIIGAKIPASLPPAELIQIEREWVDLDLEVARRGPRWTVADLISEGFGSVRSV